MQMFFYELLLFVLKSTQQEIIYILFMSLHLYGPENEVASAIYTKFTHTHTYTYIY